MSASDCVTVCRFFCQRITQRVKTEISIYINSSVQFMSITLFVTVHTPICPSKATSTTYAIYHKSKNVFRIILNRKIEREQKYRFFHFENW